MPSRIHEKNTPSMAMTWRFSKQPNLSPADGLEVYALWTWFLTCFERFQPTLGSPQNRSSEDPSTQAQQAIAHADRTVSVPSHNRTQGPQQLIVHQQGFELRLFTHMGPLADEIELSLNRSNLQEHPKIAIKLRLSANQFGEVWLECPAPLRAFWIKAITERTGQAQPALPLWTWIQKGAIVIEDDPIEGVERHYRVEPKTGTYSERTVDTVAASPDRVRILTSDAMEQTASLLRRVIELRLPDGESILILQTEAKPD